MLLRALAPALGGLLLAGTAGAESLPPWQSLVFAQKRFGISARSQVELVPDPQREGAWLLNATSLVAGNRESVALTLAAGSAAVLERSRFSSGRNQRVKDYQYLPGHLLRLRREPSDDPNVPRAQWPVSSRREIAYPPGSEGLVLTEAYALLPLAWRLQACPGQPDQVAVHTDFNFYRVRMTVADGPEVQADYAIAGSATRETGPRATRAVELQVSPLGKPQEPRDFSLLGLDDGISILFDMQTGLPLQLRGTAPRVGATRIDLREVVLRKTAP